MPYEFSKISSNKTSERERERDDIFSFQNLLKCYYQCRKNKRYTYNAAKFEINFEKELLKLEQELKSHTYQPAGYICFAITDPKLREVWATDFRDRVIHHLLVSYLESIWEKKFIFHSYACRKEKGAHKAIRYLKRYTRSATANFTKPVYYLKIDIQSFFPSIDKNILFSLIKKHTSNPEILWLSHKIIFQNPTDNYVIRGDKELLRSVPKHKSLFYAPKDKGLPIGNLTSQFFANICLSELDQFIKHKLKCHYYFRYMDDFVILHPSKTQLLYLRNEISSFVEKRLNLRLHPKKQILQPITNGINWLGYIIKPDYSLSRRRVVSNLKQKLYYFNQQIPESPNLESLQKVQARVNSYYGHFKHANCFNLRRNLYLKHFKKLKQYLKPADESFSHFVIKEHCLNLQKQNWGTS